MKTPPLADEIDLTQLFFKLRRRWPLFALALVLAGVGAYLYLQVTPPLYAFRATMLLGDQAAGSKRAQDLLQLLDVKNDKGLKMEDELGLISSSGTMQAAVQCLPYAVAYFREPASWLNRLRPLVVREQAAAAMPFAVAPVLGQPQLTGVRIYVEPAGPGQYRVRAEAGRSELAYLPTGNVAREVARVHLDELVAAGDTLRSPLLRLVISPRPGGQFEPKSGRYAFVLRDLPTATDHYASGLAVRPIDHESRIVELKLKSTVPTQAIMFLDTLMTVYVAASLREKNSTGRQTLLFMDDEIGKLAHTRRQTAGALSVFRASRGVVDVSAQSSSGIQRLGALEAERAKAATSRRYCLDMLAYLRASRSDGQIASPSSAGIEDAGLAGLVVQLSDLNNRRATLRVSGSDNNPLIVALNERIRGVKDELIQTLTNLSRTADIGLRDLDTQLAQLRTQISQMPENERELTLLKGESDFNEKNYGFLVARRNEAALALATNTTDKHVVDRARGNGSADSPNPRLVGLLALLAGLLLPTGLVLLLDKTNRTIQGQEDLAQITDIPVLGVVAHGTRTDTKELLYQTKGPLAESFRSIRVNLQYLTDNHDKQVLGVTSSVPGEGKTFCAVNLATALARSGRRVVLVETDLRRPTVASYFGQPASGRPGLASYLDGRSTLAESCRPSAVPGLDLLLCGTPPAEPTQLLESPRMHELLLLLRASYDYVVLDTPPVVFVAEYFVLVRHLDATVYVVRHNYTDRSLVTRINDLYQDEKIRAVYIIINDVNFTRSYEYRHQQGAYSYYR